MEKQQTKKSKATGRKIINFAKENFCVKNAGTVFGDGETKFFHFLANTMRHAQRTPRSISEVTENFFLYSWSHFLLLSETEVMITPKGMNLWMVS